MKTMSFGKTVHDAGPRAQSLGAFLATRARRRGPLPGPDAPGDVFVVFEESAWLSMLSAARSNLRVEQIGVMHGEAFVDGDLTWIHIRHALHAQAAGGTPVHADLDAHAWEVLHAEAARRGVDTARDPIVGWWHTHPDLGAFFSGTDRHTQARAFPLDWQVGLVIDPVRKELAQFAGPRSNPVARRILVVSQQRLKRRLLPALAVALPLPRTAEDLGRAAWDALLDAAAGCRLYPIAQGSAGLAAHAPALVFDRPRLKRRFASARAALKGPGRGPGNCFEVALELTPDDVSALLIDGHVRGVADLFPGSGLP